MNKASLAYLCALVAVSVPDSAAAQGRSGGPGRSAPVTAMPTTVDICLMGATVSPVRRPTGDAWQPMGKKATPEVTSKMDKAFKLLAVAASIPAAPAAIAAITLDLFAPSVMDGFSKPKVYGTFEMAPKGAWTTDKANTRPVASAQSPVRDFAPAFNVCFKDTAFDKDMLFRVHLYNQHTVVQDDDIATVEVNASHVAAIYKSAEVRHLFVGSQDRQQLLAVSLAVSKGASSVK